MVTSLFVPSVLAVAGSSSRDRAAADWFFCDDRFPAARRLAEALAGPAGVTAVQGDVTHHWNAGLKEACRLPVVDLQGVTTESFHFCLKILAGELARVETHATRIDRDLFLWQIRCSRRVERGVMT